MDLFDMPTDKIRTTLETQAGKDALWASGRKAVFTIRCPRKHTLARMHDFSGVAVLSIGPVRQATSFTAGVLATDIPARAFFGAKSYVRERGSAGMFWDTDIARCKCASWAIGRLLAFSLLEGAWQELPSDLAGRGVGGQRRWGVESSSAMPEWAADCENFITDPWVLSEGNRLYSGAELAAIRGRFRDVVARTQGNWRTSPEDEARHSARTGFPPREELRNLLDAIENQPGRKAMESLMQRAEDIVSRYGDSGGELEAKRP